MLTGVLCGDPCCWEALLNWDTLDDGGAAGGPKPKACEGPDGCRGKFRPAAEAVAG